MPAGTVITVSNVFITALHVSAANTSLFVQEPQGVTTSDHTYPEYAGVHLFASAAQVTALPDFAVAKIGDCVSFTGTVSEFRSDTEILFPAGSALTRHTNAADCGSFPSPLLVPSTQVTFADIATNADVTTTTDQPGPKAEVYEDVLMDVRNVAVSVEVGPPATDFRVRPTSSNSANLLIDTFVYGGTGAALPTTTVGQTFSQIIGVYTQFDNYRLTPRSAADLVTP